MIKTSLMRNHVLYDDLLIKKGGGQAASDLSSIKTFKFLLKLFTLTGLDIGVPGGMPPFLRFLKCPGMHGRPLESFFTRGPKMHRYKIHINTLKVRTYSIMFTNHSSTKSIWKKRRKKEKVSDTSVIPKQL